MKLEPNTKRVYFRVQENDDGGINTFSVLNNLDYEKDGSIFYVFEYKETVKKSMTIEVLHKLK